MRDEVFNVLDYAPIVTREVNRLSRLGFRIDADDARQDGFLALLEAGEQAAALSARLLVRRRLLASVPLGREVARRYHARAAMPFGRGGNLSAFARSLAAGIEPTSLDALVDAQHDDDPRVHVPSMAIDSREQETVDRLAISQALHLCPPPEATGATRQARHQQRARWLKRMHRALQSPRRTA